MAITTVLPALKLALCLLYIVFDSPADASTRSERDAPKQSGVVYSTPAYSHMVPWPHDMFPEPAKAAWVYFVGINKEKPHYLHWALTSIQCLQNTNTKWDIVVFFEGTDDSAADYFRQTGVRVILLSEYITNINVDLTEFNRRNQESDAKAGWYHAWNKLLAWTFTEYEKLVLIDSDTSFWDNADELMRYPEFSAVQDSVWPLMSKQYAQYFNTDTRTGGTGVIVIKPSVATFNSMIAMLNGGWSRPQVFWWDLSEQTFLNVYFNTSWYHLPISYNYVSLLLAGALADNWNAEGLKIVHHLRESQYELPYEEKDCLKHFCPQCCKRLVQCKSVVFDKVGIVQQRPRRVFPNEHYDEENARYINLHMERLGLI